MTRKVFGRFSGTNITICLVALILGVPSTVYAAGTLTNVAVQDPTTGAKAGVDSQHRLQTVVSGNVTATQAAPSSLVSAFGFVSTVNCTRIYTPPAGKALIATEFTANIMSSSGVTDLAVFRDSSCSAASLVSAFSSDRQAETVQRTFPSGIAFKSSLYAFQDLGGSSGSSLSVSGFLVPAVMVP